MAICHKAKGVCHKPVAICRKAERVCREAVAVRLKPEGFRTGSRGFFTALLPLRAVLSPNANPTTTMPAPLTWDTPSLFWDSASWDGVAATSQKTMNNTKAIIDFSGYTAAELGPVAQTIHTKTTLNAAIFTAPPITMAALLTLITTYDEKLVARTSRATADVIAFNEAREELESQLGVLGGYVNTVAKGDPVIVEKSGFPFYTTGVTPDTSPPEAPTDLKLRHGDVSGTVVARYKPRREPSTNEVQINSGDPNDEASWHTKGIFQRGRAELTGLTPGMVVWVRVRTVGLKGIMGAWSDPAQIRVV